VEPFDLLPYWDPAALDAVLPPGKRREERDAYVELHNLIAAAEGPHAFGPEDPVRIGRRHGVDLRRARRTERLALYATYLHHVLARGRLAEPEQQTLAHLARTLHLDAAVLRPLHEEAFGRTVTSVLSNDYLNVEERLLLYTLQHALDLGAQETGAAYEAAARERLLAAVARVLCDGTLSPEEAREIETLEAALDVRVPARVEGLLNEAAQRWHVHHGPLPTAEVGVQLQPGEVGHYRTAGRWREVNYARLRMLLNRERKKLQQGQTAGLRIPDEAMLGRRWHEGRIAVTSERLILLRDRKKPTAHLLAALIGVERYANGVRISPRKDRTFLLDAGAANPTFFAVLWRVLYPHKPLPAEGTAESA
jgi:hypothetical protein